MVIRTTHFLLIASVVMVATPSIVSATSWVDPSEYEISSLNSNIVARVTPATTNQAAMLRVSSVRGGNKHELWAAILSNPVSPGYAMVTDDGKAVVTFGDWPPNPGEGYGENVLAFYSAGKLIRRYSLEQMGNFTPKELAAVPNSTAGRMWSYNSFIFFAEMETLLCIWIDWGNRWLAWNLINGERIQPTPEQVAGWNSRTRKLAVASVRDKTAHLGHYEFLGKMRVPEDRPLIDALLTDTNFPVGQCWSSRPGSPTVFSYCATSDARKAADRILMAWDNLRLDGSGCDYCFLGCLELSVTFPSAPRKGEGFLRLWLEPLELQPDPRRTLPPSHSLVVNLESSYPRWTNPRELGEVVNFSIHGITPGKYRVKAMWDLAEPYCPETASTCVPTKGDCESLSEPIVMISAGEAVTGISVECTPCE